MKRILKTSTILVAIGLALPLAATAADDMQPQTRPGATPSARQMPETGQPGQQAVETGFFTEQTGKNGVRYVTGGVGEGEQSTLKQRYGGFSLMLVNATRQQGAYVADVQVTVRDAKGNEVLGTTTDGPWLFADLPPGRYTVEASYNGNKQTRGVNVGGQGQQRVVMTWAEGAS